ncbi:MAG: helicase C-terminal domain-containing protein [Candidatus Woesearchaeota archaeon]
MRDELVKKFKDKEIEVLFSTKCNRGVDFPGEICNSIIFTKYPYPNVSSLFWQILKKSKPEYYSMFYKDKAEREFLQRVYRGLRSEKDHINILSPDIRILNSIGLVK